MTPSCPFWPLWHHVLPLPGTGMVIIQEHTWKETATIEKPHALLSGLTYISALKRDCGKMSKSNPWAGCPALLLNLILYWKVRVWSHGTFGQRYQDHLNLPEKFCPSFYWLVGAGIHLLLFWFYENETEAWIAVVFSRGRVWGTTMASWVWVQDANRIFSFLWHSKMGWPRARVGEFGW